MVSYFGSISRGRENVQQNWQCLYNPFKSDQIPTLYICYSPLLFIISATVTTGYVKILSNFYHQLPIPQCPGPPHGVKFVCISPPGNQVINFPFIYQELLPKKKIIHRLWLMGRERERTSLERERETAKKEKKGVAFVPRQMENANSLEYSPGPPGCLIK